MFKFVVGDRFAGDEIDLVLQDLMPADPEKLWVPAYNLHVVYSGAAAKIGEINVRIGYTDELVKYGGHVGYGIDPDHRGHRFAAKACRLIKPIFLAHGMDVVWITCNPDNWPSRKTCEFLGCEFIEIVDLPPDNDMYREGERQKCRYRWTIYP